MALMAHITLEHEGTRYEYDDTSWLPTELGEELFDAWRRWVQNFDDGNYGCDCNLSTFIKDNCDPEFPEMPCGTTIRVVSIEPATDVDRLIIEHAQFRWLFTNLRRNGARFQNPYEQEILDTLFASDVGLRVARRSGG